MIKSVAILFVSMICALVLKAQVIVLPTETDTTMEMSKVSKQIKTPVYDNDDAPNPSKVGTVKPVGIMNPNYKKQITSNNTVGIKEDETSSTPKK